MVPFVRNHFTPMLVQQVQQALAVEQHLHQPLGLHLPHFFFFPSFRHAVLNDCISGERYCMWAPRWALARAGVGVSRSPWCLSGDTLDSDHGHSCLHHHLLAEIQIITCVLMWVVVLICGQSHWSMKGTAAIAHGIAHVFQDEDGEGARGRDELLWMCERRCVENPLFTAAAISLCYFWVFQINKNVPYPYSMPNNAFMSVIQPFDCLLLHWLPQKK